EARKARLVQELGLSDYDANVLVADQSLVSYFETALGKFEAGQKTAAAKPLVNWITTELLGRLNADNKAVADSPIAAPAMAELVQLVLAGTLSGKMAKDVFADSY